MSLCAHCPLAGGRPCPWRRRASLARSGNVSGLQALWARMHPEQHTGSKDSTGPPALDRRSLSPLAPTADSPLPTRSLTCSLICSQTSPHQRGPLHSDSLTYCLRRGCCWLTSFLPDTKEATSEKKSSYLSPTRPSLGCKAGHGHGPELGEGQAVCRGHSW